MRLPPTRLRTALATWAGLAALVLAPAFPAGAAPTPTTSPARVGVKLLDAPETRRNDPRARIYVVDHVNPGTTIRRRLQVHNDSPERRRVDLYAAAASIGGSGFTFAAGTTGNQLTSWASLDQPVLDLAPQAKRSVLLTIAVPRDAAAGERYAVVWAQASAPSTTGRSIGLVNRVGVRVYLDVGPGGEKPSDFTMSSLAGVRGADGRPRITATVVDTGGRAIDLTGTVSLTGGPGGVRAGPFGVMPGTTLAPGGRGTVTAVLDRALVDGPWTVTMDLRSGTVTRKVTGTLTLRTVVTAARPTEPAGFPTLPVVLAGLVVLAVVGFVLWTALRRRRREPATAG